MPDLTPSERVLRARLAAHEKWAQTARQAFLDRFERQVDPDGILDPAERARRAESAKRAHFLRLSLKSARARRRARDLTATAAEAEAELSELGEPA